MSDLSLKDVMRTFPQGTTVVTAEGDDGPRGITVSSFTSVSLTPRLVLICILKDSSAHDAIKTGRFVVNVLAEGQGAVSDHVASPKLSNSTGTAFPSSKAVSAIRTARSSIRARTARTPCSLVKWIKSSSARARTQRNL